MLYLNVTVHFGQIALDLDGREQEMMAASGVDGIDYLRFMQQESGNVASDGNFSIQVLSQALDVWGLTTDPFTSPQAADARSAPQDMDAFIW